MKLDVDQSNSQSLPFHTHISTMLSQPWSLCQDKHYSANPKRQQEREMEGERRRERAKERENGLAVLTKARRKSKLAESFTAPSTNNSGSTVATTASTPPPPLHPHMFRQGPIYPTPLQQTHPRGQLFWIHQTLTFVKGSIVVLQLSDFFCCSSLGSSSNPQSTSVHSVPGPPFVAEASAQKNSKHQHRKRQQRKTDNKCQHRKMPAQRNGWGVNRH